MSETRARQRSQIRNEAIKPYPQKAVRPRTGFSRLGTRTKTKGWCWKRLRLAPPNKEESKTKPAKQADWQMLKLWAELKLVNLAIPLSCWEWRIDAIPSGQVERNRITEQIVEVEIEIEESVRELMRLVENSKTGEDTWIQPEK